MRTKAIARPVEDAECIVCGKTFTRYVHPNKARSKTCGRLACSEAARRNGWLKAREDMLR